MFEGVWFGLVIAGQGKQEWEGLYRELVVRHGRVGVVFSEMGQVMDSGFGLGVQVVQ